MIVADDGEGIPDADLPRIFDRFYQADVARSSGGSGLGLSIASWIVAEHDGQISARNNDHGGTTVIVTLPAASDDSIKQASGPVEETSDEGNAASSVDSRPVIPRSDSFSADS